MLGGRGACGGLYCARGRRSDSLRLVMAGSFVYGDGFARGRTILVHTPTPTPPILILILRTATPTSPRVHKPQRIPLPHPIHKQKPSGHERDDQDGERRRAFGQRDDEDGYRGDDLRRGVEMHAEIAAEDAGREGREVVRGGEDGEEAVEDGAGCGGEVSEGGRKWGRGKGGRGVLDAEALLAHEHE